MTLVTTTPGGRALVLTALKRTRLRRTLHARRRDVARCFPDEKDPATEATATGPERSGATRASAPTDIKVGGPRG